VREYSSLKGFFGCNFAPVGQINRKKAEILKFMFVGEERLGK
jgi:hypothetical protein